MKAEHIDAKTSSIPGAVELFDQLTGQSYGYLPAVAAAFLARGILGCAALAASSNRVPEGTLGDGVEVPVLEPTTVRRDPQGRAVLELPVVVGCPLVLTLSPVSAAHLARELQKIVAGDHEPGTYGPDVKSL